MGPQAFSFCCPVQSANLRNTRVSVSFIETQGFLSGFEVMLAPSDNKLASVHLVQGCCPMHFLSVMLKYRQGPQSSGLSGSENRSSESGSFRHSTVPGLSVHTHLPVLRKHRFRDKVFQDPDRRVFSQVCVCGFFPRVWPYMCLHRALNMQSL